MAGAPTTQGVLRFAAELEASICDRNETNPTFVWEKYVETRSATVGHLKMIAGFGEIFRAGWDCISYGAMRGD
jgi:hypothetical protein